MRAFIGKPGSRSRMRIHRRGQVVTVDDGLAPARLTCRSSGLARTLVRKLTFLAEALPERSPGEVLAQSLLEVEAWMRRQERRLGRRATC